MRGKTGETKALPQDNIYHPSISLVLDFMNFKT